MQDFIKVQGARQHNLKNINVDIPNNKLVVITGISGSGKSSLAFDTIYAEGQRRYVESLSSYARQFLGVMDKPDVDRITGLSPAIAIDQKAASSNPRSTVATITEIYDYLRLLFARVGHPHCPNCGREIKRQTGDQITTAILESVQAKLIGRKPEVFEILSPVVRDRKGEFSQLFSALRKDGYQKVVVDEKDFNLGDNFLLIKTNKHSISVVVDRLSLRKREDPQRSILVRSILERLAEAVEKAIELSEGLVELRLVEARQDKVSKLYSTKFACPECNISLAEIEPRMFSFNSPHGACPRCSGLGTVLSADPEAEIDIPNLLERYLTTDNEAVRRRLSRFIISDVCPECRGARLRPESLRVTVAERNIAEVTGMTCARAKEFIDGLIFRKTQKTQRTSKSENQKIGYSDQSSLRGVPPRRDDAAIPEIATLPSVVRNDVKPETAETVIAEPIVRELSTRLEFLISVGLDYLTLDRRAGTLAGGEIQRIRLASQIGTGLTGIVYVLDEPTIGLHQRDNSRLLSTLYRLRDLGNTVIVVEHDRETIEAADWVIDIGPGAGKNGGAVMAEGRPEQIKKNPKSITGDYLSGRKSVVIGKTVEQWNSKTVVGRTVNQDTGSPAYRNTDESIKLYGASQNNLKHIDVEFPLRKFICVTGVSGSGKSTLVHDTLYHALARQIYRVHHDIPGKYDQLYVPGIVQKVSLIDQSPIGRTPRSNPATYSGAFTPIRELFSQTKEARLRGYRPGRFSFNVAGGRCEACEGQGQIKVEMQFLPDIYVKCEVCSGTRYSRETLEVEYRGKTIYDVLKMPIAEALEFLGKMPLIRSKLSILERVGLGYLELGQPAPILSGGEAQRLKLSRELGKVRSGHTIYLLDEPTRGLHFADLQKLLDVLYELVKLDNTVVVIEHNLDVVKNAQWIIDLGPEGGDRGGEVVAAGTPEQVAGNKVSYTGQYLKKVLKC
jgi:excinuclease ABC subunit A